MDESRMDVSEAPSVERMEVSSAMICALVAFEASIGAEIIYDRDPEVPDANVLGYFQRIGVTARDQARLVEIVRDFVAQDPLKGELIEIYEQWNPDFAKEDRDIFPLIGDLHREGIWYKSGYAFFTDEEEEDEEQ